MTMRRALWLAAAVVVVVSVIITMAIPRFANTRERAELAETSVLEPATVAADYAAPASDPALARAAPLRLPSFGDLRAETPPDSTRLLIRTGEMAIKVDSLEAAVEAVTQAARSVGGFVAGTQTFTTDAQRSSMMEVKIPAARFDAAVERLRALGDVQSVTVSVEDVGEEYTDVAARMANAQRLEARLLALLQTRTGRLEDVLQVERELARVREEIERYQGRLQYLRQHAAMSTLTVRLFEQGALIGNEPGLRDIGKAFVQAWRNFIGFMALLVAALGVIVPLGVLALGGWWIVRRFGKKPA